MVVHRRPKNKRFRGNTTHGYGSMKKHRGAGHRGGRGMAGSGKRADQKKPTILKLYGASYFGKHGFLTPQGHYPSLTCMNAGFLDAHLDTFFSQKLVEKKGDIFIADLSRLGCDKLLGRGPVTHKIQLSCQAVSAVAKEKIEKAGGSIVTHGSD